MIALSPCRWIVLWLSAVLVCALQAQPANDAFSSPIPLSGLPVTTSATNVGATLQSGEPLPLADATGSVWFSWTPATSGTVSISTHGSNFDTVLAVWSGDSLANLSAIASNDDDPDLSTDANPFFQSRVRVDVKAGTTYRIAVYGFFNDSGNISLAVTADPNQPANDSLHAPVIASALPVVLSGSNVNATLQTAEPVPAGTATGSVWFEWISPVSGDVRIDTFGSDFDTILAVWTGEGFANLVSIAQNDDSDSLVQSRVWINAVEGTSYRIAVYGFSGASGAITLNISEDSGSSISGTVRSQSGLAPLRDIQVTAYQWIAAGEGGSWTISTSALTAADGSYSLRGLNAGTYRVGFVDTNGNFFSRFHAGASDLASATDIVANGFSPISGIDALLAPDNGRRITGLVTGIGGLIPLPGIQVTAYRWSPITSAWVSVSSVFTANDGSYTIRDLDPGVYRVGFQDFLANFAASFFSNAASVQTATDITVDESTAAAGINASLVSASTRPGNDDFFEPAIISGYPASVNSTNVGATIQSGEPLPQADATRSIWFSWQSPVTAPVAIDTFASGFDTVLAVWTGNSLSGLSPVVSNDDVGASLQSRVRLNAVQGTLYRIAVYGVGGAAGAVSLNIAPDLSSRISGTVSGPDGSTRLSGIVVTLYQPSEQWDPVLGQFITQWQAVGTVDSGAAGDYAFENLVAGIYRVGFSDPGGVFPDVYFNGSPLLGSASDINVPEATGVIDIDAVLGQSVVDEGPGELTLAPAGPGSFSLQFHGVAGSQYQLQQSDDLNDWTDVGSPFTADSEGNSFLRESGGDRMFWRVRRLP